MQNHEKIRPILHVPLSYSTARPSFERESIIQTFESWSSGGTILEETCKGGLTLRHKCLVKLSVTLNGVFQFQSLHTCEVCCNTLRWS